MRESRGAKSFIGHRRLFRRDAIDGFEETNRSVPGVEHPRPVGTDLAELEIGPFTTREDALSAVSPAPCLALLSGDWEPQDP
jgi:hypothetical protein